MLASLGHPYIAGLIDAGATADGIPYAVIEKVDGIPIDSYCDACRNGRERPGRHGETCQISKRLRRCRRSCPRVRTRRRSNGSAA